MINIGTQNESCYNLLKAILNDDYIILKLQAYKYETIEKSPFESSVWINFNQFITNYKWEYRNEIGLREKIFNLQSYLNFEFPKAYPAYEDSFYYLKRNADHSWLWRYETETIKEFYETLKEQKLLGKFYVSPQISFSFDKDRNKVMDFNNVELIKGQISKFNEDISSKGVTISAVIPPVTNIQFEVEYEKEWESYKRDNAEEDNDEKHWKEFGENEERQMDKETDGFWRED